MPHKALFSGLLLPSLSLSHSLTTMKNDFFKSDSLTKIFYLILQKFLFCFVCNTRNFSFFFVFLLWTFFFIYVSTLFFPSLDVPREGLKETRYNKFWTSENEKFSVFLFAPLVLLIIRSLSLEKFSFSHSLKS